MFVIHTQLFSDSHDLAGSLQFLTSRYFSFSHMPLFIYAYNSHFSTVVGGREFVQVHNLSLNLRALQTFLSEWYYTNNSQLLITTA